MRARTSIQIIDGLGRKSASVDTPYDDYMADRQRNGDSIPHDVISRTVDGASPLRAWREYLGLTQAQVAEQLEISQSAYAQQESRDRLRKASRKKIAAALGIAPAQLDF